MIIKGVKWIYGVSKARIPLTVQACTGKLGVAMQGPASRDEASRAGFVTRRRVLLAVGGFVLINGAAAGVRLTESSGHAPPGRGAPGNRGPADNRGPAARGTVADGRAVPADRVLPDGRALPADRGAAADGAAAPGHPPEPEPARTAAPGSAAPADLAGPNGLGDPDDHNLLAEHGVLDDRPPSSPNLLNQPLFTVNDDNSQARAIALTIDDGPDPVYTPQVLALLQRYQVTATFSMIGMHVAAYPQLAQAVADAGHQIANHTWNHADLASLGNSAVDDELVMASEAIYAAAGMRPAFFRAPYGSWSAAVLRQCEQMQMVPVDWSVDPQDWSMPGVRSIVNNIMNNTRPGSIILEHDGGGNRSQTVAALRIVLPRLLDEGYQFVIP